MKKTQTILNPILARAFLIDPKIVDVTEECPEDPIEFLDWWWNTKAVDCKDCPLFQTRNSVVRPDGIYGAPIMIVGEGPGFMEDLCIAEDSLIYTDKGLKSIQSIQVDDKVITTNGVFNSVKKVHKKGIKDTLSIRAYGAALPLNCTPDHKVYVMQRIGRSRKNKEDKIIYSDPLWIPAGDIKKGDYLLTPRYKSNMSYTKIDLTHYVQDFVERGGKLYPTTTRSLDSKGRFSSSTTKLNSYLHSTSIGIFRDIQLDYNLGEIIGWYLAEGRVTKSKNISTGVELSLNKKDPIDHLIKLIEKIFGVEGKVYKEPNCVEAIKLGLHSKLLGTLFLSLFGTGSHIKNIPTWFLDTPDDFKQGILDGHFKGDSGFSCSIQLLESLGYLGLSIGKKYSIMKITQPERVVNGRILLEGKLYMISYGTKNPSTTNKVVTIMGDFLCRKVKSIEGANSVCTYDLTIEDDPSFYIANVGLVHNCSLPLVGPLELRGSRCNNCNNCSSCFKSRVLSHPEARTGARRVVKCVPSITTQQQAPGEFYIRSAGSVFDGILLSKWKFTYPRHNWVKYYNEHNPDNKWEHSSPWYITNTTMCRAVDASKLKDEPPPSVAMAKCKKHLVYQVAALEPKIIVALGTKAKEVLLGTTKAKQVARGEIVQSKFGPVICDVHPAHLMRETQKEFVGYGYAKIADTLQKALEYVGLSPHE